MKPDYLHWHTIWLSWPIKSGSSFPLQKIASITNGNFKPSNKEAVSTFETASFYFRNTNHYERDLPEPPEVPLLLNPSLERLPPASDRGVLDDERELLLDLL